MQVIKLYFQGSEKNSIHRLLRVSRPTVDAWIQRFETEHFAGLADRSRAPQAPVRQIWLPLMVQVYHLQKVHPDAGAFRIWKPVFNILEGTCEVILVNAQHVKAVPGRKTGVRDAAWLAELLQHGLWRASFIPTVAQRELRDLTRYRSTFIRERVTLINRVQKLLEDANIKLAAVASDIMGVSGRAILAALIARHTAPHMLAELVNGRLRSKRDPLGKVLEGRVKPRHRFVLTELLCQIDSLDRDRRPL